MRHPPAMIATAAWHRAVALLASAALSAACLSLAGARGAAASAAGPGPAGRAALEHPGARIVTGRTGSGSVPLGGSPAPAANPGRTRSTFRSSAQPVSARSATDFVDIVNAAKCNSTTRSDCRVVARARPASPLAATIDQKTDTIYVINGGATTSPC